MFRIERQLDMRWCILSEIFKNKFTTIQFHVVYFIAAGLKAIYFVSFLIKMWSSFVIYKLADFVTNTIALLIYYRSTPTIGWRSLHFSSSLFPRLLILFFHCCLKSFCKLQWEMSKSMQHSLHSVISIDRRFVTVHTSS